MIYVPPKEAGIRARAEIEARRTVGVKVEAKVLLPLLGAPKASPISSFFPAGKKLQRELR